MKNAIIAAAALLGLAACTETNEAQIACAADPRLPQCQGDSGVGDAGATTDGGSDALPAVEICDGIDNDGDGQADEELDGRACPDGTQHCVNGEWECAASDAATPDAGRTDDATTPDAAAPDAACPNGVQPCTAGATCTILIPTPPPPGEEPRPSDCWRVGSITCDPCGEELCQVNDARAAEELCDGLDNNCDGEVDGVECTPFPREGDRDGDGIDDAGDVCPNDLNLGQADGDDDGYGDICDNCPNDLNLGQPDRDRDGIGDICDANPICPDNRPPAGADGTCDGLDDDCDGTVDEDWTAVGGDFCNTGLADNPATQCSRGHLRCVSGQVSCIPENAEDAERCNSQDDDCDGEVDEGLTWLDPLTSENLPLGTACSRGQGECLRDGMIVCEFGDVTCDAQERQPPHRDDGTCDALDNDCDGAVDEDAPDLGTCQPGTGACQRIGQRVCRAGSYVCDTEAAQPTPELCNRIDDDCDGSVDEDFTIPGPDGNNLRIGAGCVLRNQVGCEARGNVICNAEGAAICNAVPPEPIDEICDGLDNDCDGTPDDGLADCCPQGFNTCGVCEPQPTDTCDALDNDCDGEVDEDFVPGPCDTGGNGICVLGTRSCENGISRCIGDNQPTAELCDNGVDENCNGVTDEPECCTPEQVNACGFCGPLPEEICDGRDNDCDGEVDEGQTWVEPESNLELRLGEDCTIHNRMCEANGVVVCNAEGAAICNAVQPTVSPEICDGRDNDCDGEVDPACNSCPEGTDVPEGWACAPSGSFQMGSPANEPFRRGDETQHQVTLTRAFLVKTTEVNQSEWARMFAGEHPSGDICDNCPVYNVSWYEVIAYANGLSLSHGIVPCYLNSEGGEYTLNNARSDPPAEPTFLGLDCTGYRLPTESEWEYAARASTTGPIYTNDAWLVDGNRCVQATDPVAWYLCNSDGVVHPVGEKLPNPWGIYDALGNVWEWTWDRHGNYPAGPIDNPLGPDAGARRVVRGSSAQNDGREVRAAIRVPAAPITHSVVIGFRLVRTVGAE